MRPCDQRTSELNRDGMNPDTIEEVRRRLLSWWAKDRRSFPWRHTRNPWHILLAEVLLHRTRAEQVVPVYQTLVKRYPRPEDLARADLSELQSIVHPLGLHWRVPLMVEMARVISKKYGGQVPNRIEDLKQLPGISDYIAGAVLCFAFNQPAPVLDTNTVRVLGRLAGEQIRDSSRRSRRFRDLMDEFVRGPQPRDLVFAILDLAATICRAQTPECYRCPLRDLCTYGRNHGSKKRTDSRGGEGSSGPPGRSS